MGFDLRSTEKNIQLYNQLSGKAGRISEKSLIIDEKNTLLPMKKARHQKNEIFLIKIRFPMRPDELILINHNPQKHSQLQPSFYLTLL